MKRKAFKKAVTPRLRIRARQTQLRYATLANVLQSSSCSGPSTTWPGRSSTSRQSGRE
jgi:hypothetical protein